MTKKKDEIIQKNKIEEREPAKTKADRELDRRREKSPENKHQPGKKIIGPKK